MLLTLNEEEIKMMFFDTCNKTILSKDEILKNLESVLNQIISVESVEFIFNSGYKVKLRLRINYLVFLFIKFSYLRFHTSL